MKKFVVYLFLLLPGLVFSNCHKIKDTGWWTGPLFASHARALLPGDINIEPYLFYTATQGTYNNSWELKKSHPFFTISPQWYMVFGLVENLDFAYSITWMDNTTRGHQSSGFSDTLVQLDYQIMHDNHMNDLSHDVLLFVGEYIPTGKFENLQPESEGVDALGYGAYITTVGINAQKLMQRDNGRLMRLRYNISYLLPAHTSVHGANAYGGGTGTQGRVYVGPTLNLIFANEIQLTQNWVFACDYMYTHGWAATFRGTPGTSSTGTPAKTGYPSWDLLSLAPAIEYNFNEHYGIIAGLWVSLAGRNVVGFISPIVAFNAFF